MYTVHIGEMMGHGTYTGHALLDIYLFIWCSLLVFIVDIDGNAQRVVGYSGNMWEKRKKDKKKHFLKLNYIWEMNSKLFICKIYYLATNLLEFCYKKSQKNISIKDNVVKL